MLNIWVANLLRIFHLVFVLFILLAPFLTSNVELLILHYQLVLLMYMKWSIGYQNWKCGFTMAETFIRGIDEDDGFIYNVLKPIVDVEQYEFDGILTIVTLILGIISYYRSEMIMRGYQV